jgi:hypothetical protein
MLSGEPMQLSQSVLSRAHTTVPPRSPDDRAILLVWLAKQETESPGLVPPAIVSDTLTANAAESLTEDALEVAWQSYVEAVREWRDAKNRPLNWLNRPSGVTSLEMARRNAQAALRLLVHGGAA